MNVYVLWNSEISKLLVFLCRNINPMNDYLYLVGSFTCTEGDFNFKYIVLAFLSI